MNANELADYLQNKSEVELNPRLEESATMLRQQHTSLISDVEVIERQYKEIQVKDEAIFNSQKQAYNLAMQVQNQKAEIEALKAENRVLRKGELWLGMVYNNRGNGIAPMYLENFMSFCETNGFTEESGYKLFKAQERCNGFCGEYECKENQSNCKRKA